jgi:hypothetical protein
MLNKRPVFAIGLKSVTRPKNGMASLVQCEIDADCFDCEGIIHHEFLPRGQIVNKEFYLRVMKRLREAVRRKKA